MIPLSLRLSLVLAGALGVAAWLVAPQAIMAAHWLAAEDDPVALAELGLDRNFDAQVAGREIAAAVAAGDVELAASFVELARERNIAVDPALLARVAAEGSAPAVTAHGAGQFMRGFITGEPDDLASLAGTATGDLFVFGDARDAMREGVRLVRGEEADEMILGLACVGLADTAGGLLHLARDIGRVQSKAGTRAALDGLRLADHPKDVARLARLAEAKGVKTRAIVKLLGRGAIMLTAGVAHLAAWVLSALVNLIWLCAVVKGAE